MLAVLLLAFAVLGVWLVARQFKGLQRGEDDFSAWLVSDASPLNRGVWRVNAWVQMIVLSICSIACLIGAFELAFGK